ncbi:MAG: hypothetical protein P4L65_06515 [Legionella sp.]|nr:hypothetical protein [Legionella sp.]
MFQQNVRSIEQNPYSNRLVQKDAIQSTLPYFIKEREKGVLDPEWQHYLVLYWQIKKINSDESLNFSAQSAPVLQLKFTVTQNGLLEAAKANEDPINYTPVEAYQVAKAIYQLAYSYTTNSNSDSSWSLKKAIGFFLMRPFAKFYPTADVLEILNCYRDLEFSFTRRLWYREVYTSSASIMTHSAVIIQRQFRKHRQAKRMIQLEDISEALKDSMHSHRVSLNPVSPSTIVPFSKEKKEHWLSKKKNNEAIYRKVLDNLVYYRSHAQFMKKLQACVRDFNTLLFSLPLELQNYAIVVPQGSIKSNHWVTALALPGLEKKPKTILFPNEIKAYVLQNHAAKHFVFFDDAIYSGRQMKELIYEAKVSDAKYTLIAPYYNELGLVRACYVDNYILGERMIRANNMESYYMSVNTWQRKDSRTLDTLFSGEWSPATSKVGFFFQHKTADTASTFLLDLHGIIPEINNRGIYY